MTQMNQVQSVTVPASADLSASQYLFAFIDSNGNAAIRVTQGADVVGVLQNKPAALGRPAQIGYAGITKVVAGGTVTAGGKAMSDGAGKAVTATSTNREVGTFKTSGVAGDLVELFLNTGHAVAP